MIPAANVIGCCSSVTDDLLVQVGSVDLLVSVTVDLFVSVVGVSCQALASHDESWSSQE